MARGGGWCRSRRPIALGRRNRTMDLINNVLLWGGDVVASLWQGIKDVLAAIFSMLGELLGPALTWLLAFANPI